MGTKRVRVGIVVGEISGDNLATSLIKSLLKIYPNLSVEGILGPGLIKLGYQSLYPMERLSVMGFVEPLARLPELFRIRNHLFKHFTENPPDIFMGVDAPDFNLGLERKLKNKGIKTVHYVSPTVWAWRQGRVHTIKKSVDLVLCLYPFEPDFYKKFKVPAYFVGHPLADEIPLEIDTIAGKKALGLDSNRPVLGILPGSRQNELKYLLQDYLLAAKRCYQLKPDLQFVVPLVSKSHQLFFEKLQKEVAPELPIKIVIADPRVAISASDVVLVTSGTATLEVMLHKKPMVVAYRTHPITYQIAKRLIKVPYISQPNLLAGEVLVPEFIQANVQPELLANALLERLNGSFEIEKLKKQFLEIHLALKKNASETAAKQIARMID